jgi:hypothetical protein
LVHYLYGELSEAEISEVTNHLRECESCQSELESLRRTFGILNEFTEVNPTEELRKRLKERIKRQRKWIGSGTYLLEEFPLRIAPSVVFGIIAVLISVFILTENLPLNNIEPRALLVCGILWSGTYIALFGLAFYRKTGENWLGKGMDSHLPNIAQHSLLSIAVATILTSFILALELNEVTDFKAYFVSLFGEFHRGWVYFISGGTIALISFLSSCLLLMRKLKEQSLVRVLLASCLFTVAVAPGLTIFCIPFMLGTYLSLLCGSGSGALTGGILSYWLVRRKIAHLST